MTPIQFPIRTGATATRIRLRVSEILMAQEIPIHQVAQAIRMVVAWAYMVTTTIELGFDAPAFLVALLLSRTRSSAPKICFLRPTARAAALEPLLARAIRELGSGPGPDAGQQKWACRPDTASI